MRPNYHPEGLFDVEKESVGPKERTNPINQLWHMNGKCPEDTIPVRRTKKEDVLRASSVKKYGKKKHRSIAKPRGSDPDLVNESGHQVVQLVLFTCVTTNLLQQCSILVLFPCVLAATM